jgi:F-type H+-transporting ATPase subunit epsilon
LAARRKGEELPLRESGMKVTVLSPRKTIFDGKAASVAFPGDDAEFEILDYHAPIVSLLRAGEIVIDWQTRLAVKKGIMKFDNQECVILIEE